PCRPTSDTAADDACATTFFAKTGRLLYRRPLTDPELRRLVATSGAAATALNDFYGGLRIGLANLLVSVPFLFRQETAEPGTDHLVSYAKANRISFLLWNSAPDSELLRAAEAGELETSRGLAHQADRLLSSPRLEAGVRAFFTDMLGFD